MTPKQRKFCDEYIISGNATDAAKKAGYSANTAQEIGAENLKKPMLRAYIDERLNKVSSSKIATQEEVLEYLTAVLRGEETEEVLRGLGGGKQMLEEKSVDGRDRIKAAELLGRRYGSWTDKQILEVMMPIEESEKKLKERLEEERAKRNGCDRACN